MYLTILILMFFLTYILKGYLMYYRCGGKKQIGKKIGEIESKKNYSRLEDIDPVLLFMIMAMEDETFFMHKGIRLDSIWEAIKQNIKNRHIVMGGSSITQQLAKNLLFDFDKTYTRKIAEVFAVRILEKKYSKNKILEIYINCIEFGRGNWDIASACQYYLKADVKEVCSAQALSLAVILPSPKHYNPEANLEAFYNVRSKALNRLVLNNFMRRDEADIIRNSKPFDRVLDIQTNYLYRSLYKNAINRARENKSALKVQVNTRCIEQVLNGTLTSGGLAEYAAKCEANMNTCYLWGGMMDKITAELIITLKKRYSHRYRPDKIKKYKAAAKEGVYGSDCSGLIKSYLFGGIDHPDYLDLYDLNSSMLFEAANKKGNMDSLPETAGVCLFMPGHVGIYIGSGQVIESTSNLKLGDGVIITTMKDREWTNWFYFPFITY